MLAASEWVNYHRELCFNDPAVTGQQLPNPQMREFVERIQLDAMREGMRRAAKVCEETEEVEVPHSYYAQLGDASATKQNIHKAIISAAESLTEKDL